MSHRGVAVVIPCRNAAMWLEPCLTSVAASRVDGTTVVLVDDGSLDQSIAIARQTAQRLSLPLEVLVGRGRGPASARNIGLGAVSCDVAIFLDADDLLAAGGLAALVAPIQRGLADCSMASAVNVDQYNARELSVSDPSQLGLTDGLAGLLDRPRVVSAFAARRPWPPWDESLKVWEVTRWQHRVALSHPRCAIVNQVVTRVRQHPHPERVSLSLPHFDPGVTGQFFAEEKAWMLHELALTPLREELVDRWLVACAYQCAYAGRRIDARRLMSSVNRARLPNYVWFRLANPSGFAWVGGSAGLYAHAALATLWRHLRAIE